MARVDLNDLLPSITAVLFGATVGPDNQGGFLTAYQILKRLQPQALQARLEAEYGTRSGKDAGQEFSPATRVAQAAARVPGIEKHYLDTGGLQFDIGSDDVEAGRDLCAIFRLRSPIGP